MAYVPISDRLRHDIRYNIRQMADKELNSINQPPYPDITAAMVEAKAWGEHYHLKPLMPEAWKSKNGRDGVHLYGFNAEGKRIMSHYQYFPPGTIEFPPRCRTEFNFGIPELPSLVFWEEYQKQKQEVANRWDNINTSIVNYLDTCKSLNDALKHMEELQYYVPQHYLDKVALKLERTKKESGAKEKAAEIDKDALVAGVIAARLAGS
jgi:hypothetical protein